MEHSYEHLMDKIPSRMPNVGQHNASAVGNCCLTSGSCSFSSGFTIKGELNFVGRRAVAYGSTRQPLLA